MSGNWKNTAVCMVLMVILLVATSGCGTIFWGAESDSSKRGNLNGWALLLDIVPGFLLGLIPLVVDLITGGLHYKRPPGNPAPR